MMHHVLRVLRVVIAAALVVGSAPSWSSEVAAQEKPAAEAGAAAPAGPASSASASPAAQTTSNATQAECAKRIAALIGKDAAALRDPEVQALAKRIPILAMCGAVVRDSDAPCELLDEDDASSCRKTRARYHAIRASKTGGFELSDEEYRDCVKELGDAVCAAARAAMSSRDPSKCPSQQPVGASCRAIVSLDPSLCPKDGEKECKNDVARYKSYAGGLQTMKKSGTTEERALAAAALDEPDACKPIAKTALESCGAGTSPPPGPTPTAHSD